MCVNFWLCNGRNYLIGLLLNGLNINFFCLDIIFINFFWNFDWFNVNKKNKIFKIGYLDEKLYDILNIIFKIDSCFV